jgi:DNA-binding NtrC family response regulator
MTKAKILIVDDNENILDALKEILEQKGFEIAVAKNGNEGLMRIEQLKPDLVITDIIMPDMEGIEFISTINKKKCNIPIIVMSGDVVGMKFLKSARILGAIDILMKPFTAGEIIERVNRALGVYP